ncbi:MAG: isoleucine--tRNA ligase [Candidatus Kerfeldbacteria bacterium]|nr:isoleucine--tRNA ligase [Candidatus Kerfeldbacteria bacterium]
MAEPDHNKENKKNQFAQFEEEIVAFWEENKCFEESVRQRPENKQYVFYDGPPFATGMPHYGHIVASLMKDMVPRYWTMRGFRVERKWGWDCHGLPIENIIEKEQNLKTKKDIEAFGVDKFNEACRATVLQYANDWKQVIHRMGRWVEMENDYKTMDRNYMESVWWVFSQLWKKGLIYQGHKAMHICPRCETTLSNFEVTLEYKEVKDISVVAKFRVTNAEERLHTGTDPVNILAWTTTPWTLPGNVLLAVGPEIAYVLVKQEEEGVTTYFVLAKDRVAEVFADKPYTVVRELTLQDVEGLTYEPLFTYFADTPNAFRVIAADFVSTEEGTGIVHIAPAFGDDDYHVGAREGVPLIQHVQMNGEFVEAVTDFAGRQAKPKETPQETDIEIVKWLAHNGKLFSKKKIEHSYPHCWRCDTPLLNYATSSWFVRVTEIKEQLLANNQKIHWVPEHMKDGRFGKWLENAHDWAISRNRYWGAPLPIWMNEDGDVLCVESAQQLEELSGQKVEDLHKHIIDNIKITQNGKTYRRIPEVLDCWFESGAMPYAQMHYPFENVEKFENGFPAEFIAEGQDQTRGWFYTLHVLATALTRDQDRSIPTQESVPAFRNVIVNGIVLAEDGKKMSKKLKNYPDPLEMVDQYGADAMRLYLAASPVMAAENLNFSQKDVAEIYRKYTNTLWNVFTFYHMFAEKYHGEIKEITDPAELSNVLDKWIFAKLHTLIAQVTTGYNTYMLRETALPLVDFVQELSTWYVRRARNRFKGETSADSTMALRTLYTVLVSFIKVAAPVTPFMTEYIYQQLRTNDMLLSVHHTDWLDENEAFMDERVLQNMDRVRKMIEQALALRAQAGIKVRQPLQSVTITEKDLESGYIQMMKEELNVKEVKFGEAFALDTTLTEELRLEGMLRELIRQTNALRKQAKLSINDLIDITISTESERIQKVFSIYAEEYQRSVLAKSITTVNEPQQHEFKIDGELMTISLGQ